MLHHQIISRRDFVSRLHCDDYDYWKSVDEVGLFPDPVMETAKMRATLVHMLSSSKKPVSIADFLPAILVPEPDPDEQARRMDAFVRSCEIRMGK